ncbi:hypothetical protein [Polluticaenibacter yanchengensis]|uniref:Uncharacterized protein n=1 Tax=Polluticaenibacter yanchengensis TaxID=3014562 RepID=A0ABT4UQR8_9BACT|nr:hypothetical protein [Chitinophagaceae bacterium LY-5]
MSTGKHFILFLVLIFSFIEVHAIEMSDSLYKILKIKMSGDYYVIHAKRNDSLFKIVSKKVEVGETHFKELKKGGYYNFTFGNKGSDTIKVVGEPLVGHASYLHVIRSRYWGDTKIKFTKRFHYRLYTTKNLIGLYYFP